MNISTNLALALALIGLGTVSAAAQTTVTVGSGLVSLPVGVAVDSSGNVSVADLRNGAVKEILLAPPPVPVPTVGFWGLLLASTGYRMTRRRQA